MFASVDIKYNLRPNNCKLLSCITLLYIDGCWGVSGDYKICLLL